MSLVTLGRADFLRFCPCLYYNAISRHVQAVKTASALIEATGTYSDTITLPDGGNYIGIECENFTGNIELNIE